MLLILKLELLFLSSYNLSFIRIWDCFLQFVPGISGNHFANMKYSVVNFKCSKILPTLLTRLTEWLEQASQ